MHERVFFFERPAAVVLRFGEGKSLISTSEAVGKFVCVRAHSGVWTIGSGTDSALACKVYVPIQMSWEEVSVYHI